MALPLADPYERLQPPPLVLLFRYLRRNKALAIGVGVHAGARAVHRDRLPRRSIPSKAYPLALRPRSRRASQYPFGTDFFGRNLLAAMVVGMWQTAVIGSARRRPRHADRGYPGFHLGIFRPGDRLR